MITVHQSVYNYIIIVVIIITIITIITIIIIKIIIVIIVIICYHMFHMLSYVIIIIIIIYTSVVRLLCANDKTASATRRHREHMHPPCTCQDVDLARQFKDSDRTYCTSGNLQSISVHFSFCAFRKKRFHVVLCSHCALQAVVAR